MLNDKEKAILVKLFIAGMRLSRAKKDNTVKQYAEQMANAVSEFLAERSKT